MRALGQLGVAAAAVYLLVLPYGHLTAIRSISFALALIAAAFGWWMTRWRVPLVAVFVTWLGAAAFSLVSSVDRASSLEAIEQDIVRSFLVFFVFYMLSARQKFYEIAVASTAVGMSVLSGLAIHSALEHGQWFVYYVPLLGEFTTSAITVLPLLVGYPFLPSANRWIVALALVAVPLIFTAGYFSMSRAFWVVTVCAVAVGVLLYLYWVRRLAWRPIIAAALIAVAGVGLAAVASYEKDRPPTYFADRYAIYSLALRKIGSNPLTGAGYGYETDRSWYAAALPNLEVFHPHNLVLGFADQMGFAGIVALIVLFGLPALAFGTKLRRLPPGGAVPCICALVLIVTVFLRNNVDYFFLKQNLWLFFAHLGVYMGRIDQGSLCRRRA